MPVPEGVSFVSQKRGANYEARWAAVTESAEAQELAEFIRESSDDFVKWAGATKDRRARLLNRFIQMHEHVPRWAQYQDVEFSVNELLERIKDFLSFLVQTSKGLLVRGKAQKLSYASLTTIRFDILSLAGQFCEDLKGNVTIRRAWMVVVEQHCQYLAKLHDIPTEKRPKFYFGMLELTQLAATALTFSTSLDNSLQHMFLWACMLYTAGRPGSFIGTKQYPDCYAKYEHLTLLRTKDPLEFLLEFKIVSWKGCHTVFSWQTVFRLSPIRDDAHLLADPGLLLVAIGLRRNAFAAHSTLESLLQGRELHITWKPELLDQPFFVASLPKGTGIRLGTPMKYDASREFLKKHCGLSGIGEQYMSAYCFRRGSATILNRVLGSELTKSILHHDQFTDTIHKHYLLPASQSDLVAAIATGEVNTLAHLSECDAPALFRGEGVAPQDIIPLSFEEALIASPELRLLHIQRDFLQVYVKAGDGMPPLDGEAMAPLMEHLLPEERDFIEKFVGRPVQGANASSVEVDAARSDAGAASLALYGRLMQRCKKVLGDMRARHRRWVIERQGQRARPITIDDLERRLVQAQQPPDIAKLLRGLVASQNCSEKELAENRGQDVIECSAPDLVNASVQNNPRTEPSQVAETSAQTGLTPFAPSHPVPVVVECEKSTVSEARTNARRQLLEELVSHKDAHRGPQACPICLVDTTLPPEKRAHIYGVWSRVERHMRARHPPHLTRPYLPDMNEEAADELAINPERCTASLLHDGHLFAMSNTVDRLLGWCAGGMF